MKKLAYLILAVCLLASCSKLDRKGMKIAGIWKCTGVNYKYYTNNAEVGDSTATPTGNLVIKFGGYASSDLPHSPFSPYTFAEWEITKQEFRQISFTADDGFTLFSNVVEITKLNKRTLVLTQCFYDNDLNIQRKVTWSFDREHI